MKGMYHDQIEEYSEEALIQLNLKKKKSELVETLSDVQRKKLHILIAFGG